MDVNAPRGILPFFADMQDPRAKQGRRQELLDILVIAICAVIWPMPPIPTTSTSSPKLMRARRTAFSATDP